VASVGQVDLILLPLVGQRCRARSGHSKLGGRARANVLGGRVLGDARRRGNRPGGFPFDGIGPPGIATRQRAGCGAAVERHGILRARIERVGAEQVPLVARVGVAGAVLTDADVR